MIDPSGQTHAPTVLAVSRYGTLWLLDARTGAVRWQLVNGCRLGQLAHGGETIYLTAYSSGFVRRDTRTWPLSRDELRQYQHLLVTPAEIIAVRTQDGSIAWRREGWVWRNQPLRVLSGGCPLDGQLLVTDVTDFAEMTPVISAVDRASGAIRWRSPCADEPGAGQLQGACAGRVYIYQEGQRRLDVLDTTTGDLLWSCEQPGMQRWQLSQGGELVAELGQENRRTDWPLTVRRASDGEIVATLAVQGSFLALTDTGIVYLAVGPEWKTQLDALRISDGTMLWRAQRQVPLLSISMSISIFLDHSFATDSSLYFARLKQSSYLAEALAFDVRSGQQRWHWRSPAHLLPLIQLWGWRTPQVIGFALSQVRRSIMRARDTHTRGHKSTTHIIAREIMHGQWRHPAALLGGVFAAAVGQGETPDDERLYIGTSMGLLALGARDGHRLWHALLMMEIGSIVAESGQRLAGEAVSQAAESNRQ
jgi:outer membrane protein assembly factor BamB